ncbi:Ran-specific GTPase-activating protein 30 [Oleoguttula sp. CCFEE 5521]
MDVLLGKVTQGAMNYAIRSGITITTGYAIKQCGRLLKEAPRGKEREELARLQSRLTNKMQIISPAIDMIDLISARGNTSLESAVSLTKEIRYDMQRLGERCKQSADEDELSRRQSSRAASREQCERQMRSLVLDIKALLERIEDAIPLINLAITTSGVNLSTKLSGTISPSRLLQASTFLTMADVEYANRPAISVQVGPTYVLSLYMLFDGHAWRPVDEDGVRAAMWKEVIHKAKVKLYRRPLDHLYDLPHAGGDGEAQASFRESNQAAEYAYQLVVIEDFDDDRVHTIEEGDPQPGPYDDVSNAGIRDVIPVHEVSKVFYADTGKILNIGGDGETNNPVLLLKRDLHADAPRSKLQRSRSMDYMFDSPQSTRGDSHINGTTRPSPQPHAAGEHPPWSLSDSTWRLPADLDPEWMAFELYAEPVESDDDDDDANESQVPSSQPVSSRAASLEPSLAGALSKLSVRHGTASPSPRQLIPFRQSDAYSSPSRPGLPPIRSSLSGLEMLLKLTALQQFRQEPHLSMPDEFLNFFLEDSATAGAGADQQRRRRMRNDAVQRVGFDPYDESPVKRRNEAYIQRVAANSTRASVEPEIHANSLPYDDDYEYEESQHPPSSPSPAPTKRLQTPSRNSTPDLSRSATTVNDSARAHNMTLRTPGPANITPPSTSGSRQSVLRSQSDSQARTKSPLARELG